MRNIAPDKIQRLEHFDVFVFESNLQGDHNLGYAKLARDLFGAIVGKNEGPQGQSYAIPIFSQEIDSIKPFIESFLLYAKSNKNLRFFVSSIGSEYGYSAKQIAPLFINAIGYNNIYLPKIFWTVIDNIIRRQKYQQGGEMAPDYYSHESLSMNTFASSRLDQYNIYIKILNNMLVIGSGASQNITGIHINIENKDTKESISYDTTQNPFKIDISKFVKGDYLISLYQKKKIDLYFECLTIKLKKTDSSTNLCRAYNYRHNVDFFSKITVDEVFLKNKLRLTAAVPGALPKFINLAKRLTKYCQSNYDKVLAIHDWIAKNISYDYDSLEDGSYKDMPIERSAIDTLLSRKGVCQGYTDLSIALLRAVGVPSAAIICFSKREQNKYDPETESNHIFTAAYFDNRWHLFDITWDSDKEYSNSIVKEKTGSGVSHLYFDCSIEFMSFTHRFDHMV